RMTKVLVFEPRDLTISVEAGLPWSRFTALIAQHGMMVPLDPPFFDQATVGGVVAANTCGPRRRGFGTVRDAVIGMQFATLQGKLIQSGGMVVKNVAGLDMSKLMIGSFGTLAAIATVNFKLTPAPGAWRTFVMTSPDLASVVTERDRILQSVMQPLAIDIFNPAAARRLGLSDFCLAVQTSGNESVLNRWQRDLPRFEVLPDETATRLWTEVREFTPKFLEDFPAAAVVRHSTTLAGVAPVLQRSDAPAIARAGNGVIYRYVEDAAELRDGSHGGVIEFCQARLKESLDLWPSPGSSFATMQRIKQLFDPSGLLNPGRLYGRI
ncbi:MAG TPA: FAD-binding protein, partial [Bryobacteraceae bacterium]|nr:FAD-binding protein [Bryobacteraceae bacterium]